MALRDRRSLANLRDPNLVQLSLLGRLIFIYLLLCFLQASKEILKSLRCDDCIGRLLELLIRLELLQLA